MAVSMLLCKTVLAKFIVITMVVEHHLGQEPDVTNLGPDATNLTSWHSLTHSKSNSNCYGIISSNCTGCKCNEVMSGYCIPDYTWLVKEFGTGTNIKISLNFCKNLQEFGFGTLQRPHFAPIEVSGHAWTRMEIRSAFTHNWQRVVSRLNQQSKAPYRPPYSRSINIHLIRNIFKNSLDHRHENQRCATNLVEGQATLAPKPSARQQGRKQHDQRCSTIRRVVG